MKGTDKNTMDLARPISITHARNCAREYAAQLRGMKRATPQQVTRAMVNFIANGLGTERAAYYELSRLGQLHFHLGNVSGPRAFESHVSGNKPHGPFQKVLADGGILYIRNIDKNRHFGAREVYWLDEMGGLRHTYDLEMNEVVVAGYGERWGASFSETNQVMDILFGGIKDADGAIGAFRVDSFPSGHSIIPAGMDVRQFLDIAGVVGDAAVESLIAYKERTEQHEQLAALLSKTEARTWIDRFARHHIKAILRTAHGFSSMIEDDLGEALSPVKSDWDVVIGSFLKIRDAVELYLAEEGAANFDLASVDLREFLVGFATTEISVFRPSTALMVTTNAVLLLGVMSELLVNASKYSERGSRIAINYEIIGSEVRLAVTDKGTGIPADKLEAIFGVGEESRLQPELEGGGFGLPALRKIVTERLGGRIWAESAGLGHGSTFYVTTPLAPQQAA